MPASSIVLRRALPGAGALILLLSTTELSAQASLSVGPGMGYEFGVPLAIRRDAGGINRRHGFSGEGESRSHTFWLGSTLVAPRLIAPRHGLMARLGLSFSSGRFLSERYTGVGLIDSTLAEPAIIRPEQQFEITSVTGDIRLDLLWRIDLSPIAIALGPWASYRVSSAFTLVDTTFDTDAYSMKLPARTVTASDTLGSDPLHLGLLAAAIVPLTSGPFQLQWEIYSRFDAEAGLNFRGLSAGTGLSLLLSPGSPPPPETVPPETPPARPSRLAATVHLRADDGDSAVVRMRDILQRRRVPLLPFIFFDAGSERIPDRFARLDRAEAGTFALDSLAGLDRTGIYRHTLDILGLRLRENPSATISLTGSVSAGEPAALARARAEEVRRYLTDIWGIAAGRIALSDERSEGPPPGPGSEQNVRITSATPAVTAPAVIEWLARDLSASAIGVDQEISAEAGVRSWTMTITQGEHLVGRYASGDDGSMEDLSLSFLVEQQESRSVLDPLVAELIVEDSTGRSTVARDSLPIIWRRDTLAVGDELIGTGYEQFHYTFLIPGGIPIRGESTEAAREIATVVRGGAAVTAYLPPSGSRTEAAERRWGTSTSTELITALQTRGIAVDRFELVTDDPQRIVLPEDALFARELRIVIDQAR